MELIKKEKLANFVNPDDMKTFKKYLPSDLYE